ncbi:hypothetical protein D3C72_558680 [compost metagenome]
MRRDIPDHGCIASGSNCRRGAAARGGHGFCRLTGWPQGEARACQRQDVQPDHNRHHEHRDADPLGEEQPCDQHHEDGANHLPVDKAFGQIEKIIAAKARHLRALTHDAIRAWKPGVMPEQPEANRYRYPVAQAVQLQVRNGHQQKCHKHQVQQRMEIEIARPEQAKFHQKVEVPAGKAAPVLPKRRRCRSSIGRISHVFGLP